MELSPPPEQKHQFSFKALNFRQPTQEMIIRLTFPIFAGTSKYQNARKESTQIREYIKHLSTSMGYWFWILATFTD